MLFANTPVFHSGPGTTRGDAAGTMTVQVYGIVNINVQTSNLAISHVCIGFYGAYNYSGLGTRSQDSLLSV